MISQNQKNSAIEPFDFECYGVSIRITGSDQGLVDEVAQVASSALLNNFNPAAQDTFDYIFEFEMDHAGVIRLTEGDEVVALESEKKYLYHFFNSLVRVAVAEKARDRVFMHAGAVGWRGKAIILPGDSFVGKTTLVAELVRNGATYYSDDYAIFDADGKLYPFPRTLSMRADDGMYSRYDITPDELGGTVGEMPLSVGAIIFTQYKDGEIWAPKTLSEGNGVLKMIPYTFSFRNRPDFSLPVLNNVARHAIIISSQRGSAELFAKTILNFVDKHVN